MSNKAKVVSIDPRSSSPFRRGTLVGLGGDLGPTVRMLDGRVQQGLSTIVELGMEHIGHEVVVAEAEGVDVVMGVLQPGSREPSGPVFEVDGGTLRIAAKERVVITCGDASITLTNDGKVTVKGDEVLSRASGSNTIFGAHVTIN